MSLSFCARVSLVLLFSLLVLCSYKVHGQSNVFSFEKYGGSSSGSFDDNSKALARAWNDACKWHGDGEAQVLVPNSVYHLSPIKLVGPCKGPVRFVNKGELRSQPGPTDLSYWIMFNHVNGLTIEGGIYNGQGQTVWDHPEKVNPGHALINLAFVDNAVVQGVKLKNSKKVHLHVLSCTNVDLNQVTVSAPETSPNTDGVKLARSTTVRLHDSHIASGDDCVAILTGTSDVNITRVKCGPGHGISIGSMGDGPDEFVRGIRAENCTLAGTQNGVRIKTKATDYSGKVSNVWFDSIVMDHAENPIIIDQTYCPDHDCDKGNSHVQINGVSFSNIHGTSASKVAVDLQCSGVKPCESIKLNNVNLNYQGGRSTSSCSNAKVTASGVQNPLPCSS